MADSPKCAACAPLLAGAAHVDITPAMGIQLAGDIGRRRPTEEIRDRLYANALVLEVGGQRACVVSLDLLSMSTIWSNLIRQRAAERYGLDPKMIMLHVVQNHATPSLGHLFVADEEKWGPKDWVWLKGGGDDAYHEPTAEQIVTVIGQALARLEPVTLQVGRGIDGRVAFNRRFVMRDGTARCHPAACDPQILHAEGPTDPEVGVATLTNAAGTVVAVLLHHTCHPCHGYPHRYVIGDWPGAWGALMRERLGEACIPVVINGCCGNIHHANHIDPQRNYQSDYRQLAGFLAETTTTVLGRMAPVPVPALALKRRVLRLPLRLLTPDVVAAAQDYLAKYPEPKWKDAAQTACDWDWVYAVSILDLKARQDRDPYCGYEVQALRLGDFALVTLMGEPFVEAQLEIKRKSPFPWTWVAHFCNGYAGYVPTRRAFAGGGYETRTSAGSKWTVGALQTITNAAVRMLRQLA